MFPLGKGSAKEKGTFAVIFWLTEKAWIPVVPLAGDDASADRSGDECPSPVGLKGVVLELHRSNLVQILESGMHGLEHW